MASFVVLEPSGDRSAADMRFVRDGFAWLGLLLPFFWLLWHRLWIEALLFLAASIGLALLVEFAGLGVVAPFLSLILALYVGIEGATLRVWAATRRGWREWGVVEADTLEDAESRYVAERGDAAEPERRAQRARARLFRLSRARLTMRVAIIDYGSGNLRSAAKAFERAARQAGIAAEIELTSNAERVRTADRVVLPGVGAYADCRAGLDAVSGMVEAIDEAAIVRGRPFLGICVGMQLMAKRGLEKTTTKGFGWIAGDVVRIEPAEPALKVPQIGWNTITLVRPHPLFEGIATGESGLHAYFVHSYQLQTRLAEELVAVTDYGGRITAAVGRDNLAGTQFHPEKSQALGLALIANFLRWRP